jgi:hypothetical protein
MRIVGPFQVVYGSNFTKLFCASAVHEAAGQMPEQACMQAIYITSRLSVALVSAKLRNIQVYMKLY